MSRSAPTPEERAKLRELHQKATPGEWVADHLLIVATHNALPSLLDALDAAEQEIARLQAGGCARDQRTTQHCAEDVGLAAENKRMREVLDEFADEGCAYKDNCPPFGTGHGVCRACKARRALKGTT